MRPLKRLTLCLLALSSCNRSPDKRPFDLAALIYPRDQASAAPAVSDTPTAAFTARDAIPPLSSHEPEGNTLRVPEENTLRVPSSLSPHTPYPVPRTPSLFSLASDTAAWRDPRYEIFRWEQFPDVLILDTVDYAFQDRMLKRLAFFAEKKGFRGRLAPDEEIAELHGWNAHDYRAATLAAFFDMAAQQAFPLLPEERELETLLTDLGLIVASGEGYRAGEGALISLSRESPAYLRRTFLAHEGFHGIFFTDEDFRAFSADRWAKLDRPAKRFLTSFFDYQQYDIQDEYLIVNEFMAHVLQQNVSAAAVYFGKTAPERIEAVEWRRAALPEKDPETGTWPSLAASFTAEAEAFSAYVHTRWSLAAGRVWQ